jgi:hypothetical protein
MTLLPASALHSAPRCVPRSLALAAVLAAMLMKGLVS